MLACLERTYPGPITSHHRQRQRRGGEDRGGSKSCPEGGGARRDASRGRRLYDDIVAPMRSTASHTIAAVAESLGGDEAYDNFPLLGYDFTPDKDVGKVWLLEVNGSPATD